MARGNWKRRLGLRLGALLRSVEGELDATTLPAFANRPRNLRIESPRRIANPGFMTIGDDVSLGPGCMLNAIRRYPGKFMAGAPEGPVQEFTPSIVIGDRVSATGYLTVSAVQSVVIEDDVLMASYIFICDNAHGIGRVDIPFKYQPLERVAPVVIGRGAWIGERVTIMPGVTVGEMSVVGAHSVVTRSIPPRSVAVGAPARVIRRWDEDAGGWKDGPGPGGGAG